MSDVIKQLQGIVNCCPVNTNYIKIVCRKAIVTIEELMKEDQFPNRTTPEEAANLLRRIEEKSKARSKLRRDIAALRSREEGWTQPGNKG